ncbi:MULTISPECIES: H-NS histone family protein [unclassified Roseivivax]|uniref:H-NS histone family protein n=1 Tax=Roseivivax sp. GX 12232 TaxID=2900547 RepID=UPI001E5A1B83|nr:H-NS histone family protein [Roseivivax sp. GX 12232]MCE0505571.1 H-NS histone family protein [Roseivivax sp. GX 12232]
MDIDLEKLSREDLEQLKKDVDKALKSVDARRKAEAKRAADHAAREFGFSLEELYGANAPKASKGVPKYANPADASQTWTGRGRKPKWLNEALAAGKSLDDMKI